MLWWNKMGKVSCQLIVLSNSLAPELNRWRVRLLHWTFYTQHGFPNKWNQNLTTNNFVIMNWSCTKEWRVFSPGFHTGSLRRRPRAGWRTCIHRARLRSRCWRHSCSRWTSYSSLISRFFLSFCVHTNPKVINSRSTWCDQVYSTGEGRQVYMLVRGTQEGAQNGWGGPTMAAWLRPLLYTPMWLAGPRRRSGGPFPLIPSSSTPSRPLHAIGYHTLPSCI